MNGPAPAPPGVEARLRRALAGTHDTEPRALADLELPFGGDKWLTPMFLSSLRRAAVLIPVREEGGVYTLLLTVRSETLRSHKGQISFPGGGRDAGDASIAANALREAQEEIGLDPARVEVLGYLDDYPTISRYRVTPVVGLLRGEFTPRIDAAEVAQVFEVPLAVALDPQAYQRRSLSREGLVIPFYELHWGAHRIWGATGGMLKQLCDRVVAHAR